jgi:uncharacterized protein (TIGR00730 family)
VAERSVARICVFCSSSERISRSHVELATDVGAELARRGHSLVSGGGRVSCMGAVARAVRAGGGHTTGVIPEALVDLEVADSDADELVVTADMRERKGEMDRRCDAFLCLPGGLGTLEELLEIWVSHTLGMHAKPIVVLDPEDVFAPLRAQVDALVVAGFVRPPAREAVLWARTTEQALDLVESALAAAVPAGRRQPVVPAADDLMESEL